SFDGAAELWFDSLDAMREAMGSDEVRAALEDEKNFIDHSRVASFVTVEHVIVGE
ncbi:MAG TPA: EthD family reductase, partial [Dehalococcoidia bacterium]